MLPLSEQENPSLAVPLGLLRKGRPEDAARLFDHLFEKAEQTFGEYPAFEVTAINNLLVARPRENNRRAPR